MSFEGPPELSRKEGEPCEPPSGQEPEEQIPILRERLEHTTDRVLKRLPTSFEEPAPLAPFSSGPNRHSFEERVHNLLNRLERVFIRLEETVWTHVEKNIHQSIRIGIGSVLWLLSLPFILSPLPGGTILFVLGLTIAFGPKNAFRMIQKTVTSLMSLFKKDTK